MKIVGFLGSYDKIDMMLYVAKMLTIAEKKVLIIDSTIQQKAKYIVPSINPTISYVTNYEGIDVSIGFNSYEDISKYLGEKTLNYDFALVNVDNEQSFINFELQNAYKNYFVTSFETYSIKKGLEIIKNINQPIQLTKILFSHEILEEENNYLDFLSLGYKISWNEYRIYFPLEKGDLSAIIDNQRVSKIRFKNLSSQYKESISYIAEELIEQQEVGKLIKTFKNYEKGEE